MDNGENIFSPYAFKTGSVQITKGDSLVRDYIPVRKGTVGYLYDRVTRKLFGNAGTGDFVLGPDVVPVEWIGTETRDPFINTGVIPTDNTGVYARMWSGDVSTTRPYIGNDQFRISAGSGKAYSHWNGVSLSSSFRVDVQSGDITASLNRNADRKFIANGVTAIT